MFCGRCGKPNQDGDKFCAHCGALLQNNAETDNQVQESSLEEKASMQDVDEIEKAVSAQANKMVEQVNREQVFTQSTPNPAVEPVQPIYQATVQTGNVQNESAQQINTVQQEERKGNKGLIIGIVCGVIVLGVIIGMVIAMLLTSSNKKEKQSKETAAVTTVAESTENTIEHRQTEAAATTEATSKAPAKNTKPEFYGVKDVQTVVGTPVDLLDGVTAIDEEDGDISDKIEVTYVNFNTIGTYTVKYSVTDSQNSTATVSCTVTVLSEDSPQYATGVADDSSSIIKPNKMYSSSTRAVCTGEGLNIRTGPGTNYDSIGSITISDIFYIYGEAYDDGGNLWYYGSDINGKYGWTYSQFISKR